LAATSYTLLNARARNDSSLAAWGARGVPLDRPRRPPSSTERRRDLIRNRIVDNGSVRIDELAEEFGVTIMTIHRDLNVLEEQGWVRKIRGGATVDPSAAIDTSVRHRLSVQLTEKEEIAACALQYVNPGDSVMVDESTTALHLVYRLPSRAPLTVITNFLFTMNVLAAEPSIELISLGGTYRPHCEAFQGLHTRESISRLRADVLFMSTTAILDGELYHESEETVLIRRALMEAAGQRILLADRTKFGHGAVHHLASLTAFDVVIVDSGIDERELASMREHDVEVRVADAGSEPNEVVPGAAHRARAGKPSEAGDA
jgi:DeoR/GlpR family transcriptional regulator of sugar metabolism